MAESASLADLVDEGMMLVRSSLRLTAKNTLIVALLRDGASWDEPALIDSMRRDIDGLIAERLADLTRLESAIDRARGRPGQPRSPDDYRRMDVPVLERRREVGEALVARLRELATDEAALRHDLFAARDSALTEIQLHRWAAAGLLPRRIDPAERARQLRALRRDVAALRRGR